MKHVSWYPETSIPRKRLRLAESFVFDLATAISGEKKVGIPYGKNKIQSVRFVAETKDVPPLIIVAKCDGDASKLVSYTQDQLCLWSYVEEDTCESR